MLRQLCLLLLLFSVTIISDAQEQSLYLPSVDDYIAAIPQLLEHSPEDSLAPYDAEFLREISRDFLFRYGETASPAQLLAAFHALNYGTTFFWDYHPALSLEDWHQRILERWIEVSGIEFAGFTEFSFETYSANATQYEIDGDAQPEWLLYAEERSFRAFWLVQTDESIESGYRLYALPIPYAAEGFFPQRHEWQGSQFLRAIDLTADDAMEMIFTAQAVMTDPLDTTAQSKNLYVLTWRDGQMQNIFTGEAVVDDGADYWQAINLDEDTSLEILQRVDYVDNFACARHSEIIYNLIEGSYVAGEDESSFEESVPCALRQGQDAMNQKDYELAVSHFLSAGERFAVLTATEQANLSEIAAFANERLVVAYAMLNQVPKAVAEIEDLNEAPQEEYTMASAWASAIEDGTDSFELCRVAFYTMQAFSWDRNYRGIPYAGDINEAIYGENNPSRKGEDKQASCDLFAMVESWAYSQDFPISEAPETILENLGLEIIVWAQDLNGDEIPERLIWLKGYGQTFFFYSHAQNFEVSVTSIWAPTEINPYVPVELPGNQMGFAKVGSYIASDCVAGESYEDIDLDESGKTYLTIWTVRDAELIEVFNGSLCLKVEADTIVVLDEEIEVWGGILILNTGLRTSYSTIYLWDAAQGIYIPQAEPVPLDGLSHPLPTLSDIRESMHKEGDIEEALLLIVELLPRANAEELQVLHYYRALALLELERNEEALAELQLVVEMDRLSIYGLLADLNLR